MRIVFVTQRVDPSDPLLGATVAKLRALAELCDEVVVVADDAVPGALPSNCRVRLFRSRTRPGRGLRFGAVLASELARRPRPAAVIAHMCPIYAVLAAPLARPLGTRVVLWFTHWKRTRTLSIAARLVNAIASVDRRSVPVPTTKTVGIGHGIDLGGYPCTDSPREPGPFRLLTLGRYGEPKGLPVVLQGVAVAQALGVDITLEVRGPAVTDDGVTERARLETLAAELSLTDVVTLGGPVPHPEVPDLLRCADAFVNNMRAGAADKAVYEAGAACLPVLASNPSFEPLLGELAVPLLFDRDDPEQLAARIQGLAQLPANDRAEIGRAIHHRVAAEHSVETWAARMVELATT